MKFIVGIDEVGRGPLAGPVSVCVVVCGEKIYSNLKKNKNLPKSGVDSKKLTPEERNKYSVFLNQLSKEGRISYKIIHISNKTIDKKGISFCIKKAMSQGLDKLRLNPKNCHILLDGRLQAPKKFLNQKTIIKGDEKEKIIAWASIIAKVSRDSLMRRMAVKFPQYGFEFHKGYGTEKHKKAIKKHGLSDFHRKTFSHIDVTI